MIIKEYTKNEITLLELLRAGLFTQNKADIDANVAKITRFFPEIAESKTNYFKLITENQGGTVSPYTVAYWQVSDSTFYDNILAYLYAIDDVLDREYQNLYSPQFINIYEEKKQYETSEVLYQDAETNNSLTVGNAIDVAGYVVKFIEALAPNETTEKASQALFVMSNFKAALQNDERQKPRNTSLHLANDYLLQTIKPHLTKEGRQVASAISFGLDMLINFFVKR